MRLSIPFGIFYKICVNFMIFLVNLHFFVRKTVCFSLTVEAVSIIMVVYENP